MAWVLVGEVEEEVALATEVVVEEDMVEAVMAVVIDMAAEVVEVGEAKAEVVNGVVKEVMADVGNRLMGVVVVEVVVAAMEVADVLLKFIS